MSCSSQSPLAEQVRQSSGWSEMYSSITPRRRSASLLFWVVTFIPASAGVVQDAGKPLRPSIWTRQRRHEPNASRLSVAQSFGIPMPALTDARITEVPSGTVTVTPSIVRVTSFTPGEKGVP